MNLDLFPRPSRLTDADVIRQRLEAAGCIVRETDRRGHVRVLRDGFELGVMTWAGWAAWLDGRDR